MKSAVRIISILLLLINGTGAIYGGFLLMADPTGSRLQMPLSFLDRSPFNDYLIPGIVLFIVNGIFSFVALVTMFLKKAPSHLFILAQGILLSGWIILQILFLRTFYAPFHATFLAIGLLLFGSGLLLWRYQQR